jgi:hypothetical protein
VPPIHKLGPHPHLSIALVATKESQSSPEPSLLSPPLECRSQSRLHPPHHQRPASVIVHPPLHIQRAPGSPPVLVPLTLHRHHQWAVVGRRTTAGARHTVTARAAPDWARRPGLSSRLASCRHGLLGRGTVAVGWMRPVTMRWFFFSFELI